MGKADYRMLAGGIALAAIAALIFGAFAGLLAEGAGDLPGALASVDVYLVRVALFTLTQAVLSTALSVLPAILVARALARHRSFPGRGLLLALFAVPLGLPAIVAAMGVLALLGRSGYFAGYLSWLGGEPWPGIYGLSGILVAHVFFNLPLATRLFLGTLESVPGDNWRLASQLGMRGTALFRFVEWPALRAALPGVAGLVFMLCVTSFTVVLMLGGGPGATTLEVAIYQALRFDFDPARATVLTLAQIALTVLAAAAIARISGAPAGDAALPVASRRPADAGAAERALNTLAILLAALLVGAPIVAIIVAGMEADLARLAGEASVLRAAGTSAVLSLLSALLAVALALAIVMARRALELRRRGGRMSVLERSSDGGASLVLVVPPIVLGAGWFLLLRHIGDPAAFAPAMVVSVNAVMAMPFALRAIRPAHDAASARHERLCAQLGISGWNRLRLVDWPVLRRPLLVGFAFAMALSLGDLGVIALFGSDTMQTLPYLLMGRMGSYRTADAAGIALMLAVICLVLMAIADRLGREGT
ncbi:MAG: thiamine/thiamine pyrophosphate ABC transporter permease [Rhizobiaceae bacterium]